MEDDQPDNIDHEETVLDAAVAVARQSMADGNDVDIKELTNLSEEIDEA